MAHRLSTARGITLILSLAMTSLAQGQIRFEDIASKAGLKFELHNGAKGEFRQPELMLGGVAVLDYNNDGCMDIFFTNGGDMPSLQKTGPEYYNRLFRNNCDGTFTDVTQQAGVAGDGYSMGVAVADYDNDGYPDIFVASLNRNILYRNRGNGTFEDVTAKARLGGVDAHFGKLWSVAAAWVDVDNDGWLDLVVSNYVQWDPHLEPTCGPPDRPEYCHPNAYHDTPNQLFRNNHDGTFTDITQSSGLGAHLGKGMGVAVADYDGDGLMDIFVANDSVPNFLFHNLGRGKFEEVGLLAGVALNEDGRPVAGMGTDFRDFDNDGRVDAVVANLNGPARLFHNVTPNAGHWLALKLNGKRSNRDGIGARVEVTLPSGRKLYNHGTTSVGYASSSEPFLRFGLGKEAVAQLIQIRWPSGQVQTLNNVKADKVLQVTEP